MTILPKKKEKQDSDSDGDHASHCAHSHSGAAGHSSTHRTSDDEESFNHNPDTYYHRHYDSCEDDEDDDKGGSSGFAVAKRSFHPPTSTATPTRTKRTEGAGTSPYASGYNSSEEYDVPRRADPEVERNFELCLKKRGFTLKRMREDGACLFRAVADQVYGDQEMHSVVRNHCLDYMMKNADYFSQFVTEDFEGYISRKRSDHCFGNNLEMQAMAEMYNRVIELYQYGAEPINIFFGVYKTDNAPIRLSYHGGIHYNSVVDPHAATIGVGLGLAGYKPGLADKTLITGALKESENVFLEQAMLEDKLRTTDWEATYEAVEDAVARESYLQWIRDNEKRPSTSKAQVEDPSMACASTTTTSPPPSTSFHTLPSCSLATPTTPLNAPPPAARSSSSSEDVKHRGGAFSRTCSPARSRSPARSHHHHHHHHHGHQGAPPTSSTTATTSSSSRHSSPSRGSLHGSPHPSRHGSPCEARHRAGSARGTPRSSPRGSPGNSPGGGSPSGSRRGSPSSSMRPAPTHSPALVVQVAPSADQSCAHRGSRKTPPSSPHHLPLLSEAQGSGDTLSSHPQPGATPPSSSLAEGAPCLLPQQPSCHAPDFESGAVLDKLPFEYSSFLDLSPSAFGFQEWEDDRILAAVLAASQQEYMDTLKQNARTVGRGPDGV